MSVGDLDARLVLSMTAGFGPLRTSRAIETLGSPASVVGASVADLCRVEGIGQQTAAKMRREMDDVVSSGRLDEEKHLIEKHRVTLVGFDDKRYPRLLRHIPDPPPLLYVKGALHESMALSIAMVGARQCTAYGREQAERFAAACCSAGLTVVSGGAYGIDAASHRAALRVGGKTIAVLGSGLAKPYPIENKELFSKILEGGGAVISELPMLTAPLRENFPRRNRIISGLSLGTLVVEAGLRSGSLITARVAAEDHGREVMAIPGRVDAKMSAGCHELIKTGSAAMVTSLEDIFDCLGETGEMLKAGVDQTVGDESPTPVLDQTLTETQKRVVSVLDEPRTNDQLAALTGLALPIVMADVTMLQVRGMIEKRGAMVALKRRD